MDPDHFTKGGRDAVHGKGCGPWEGGMGLDVKQTVDVIVYLNFCKSVFKIGKIPGYFSHPLALGFDTPIPAVSFTRELSLIQSACNHIQKNPTTD